MTRRLLITGVLLLLGGAIVNVAVAWGAALGFRCEGDSPVILSTGGEWWHANYSLRRAGTSRVTFIVKGTGSISEHALIQTYTPNVCSMPSWALVQGVERRDGIAVEAAGLPFLTLRMQFRGDPRLIDLIDSRSTHGALIFGTVCLPALPIWPGFAINTIFYAAMLWVVFFVPGMVRRRIRRRRGRCPACAYPIGTSPVCTECGANLPLPLGEGRGEGMNKHDGRSKTPSPLTPLPEGEGNDNP